MSDRRAQNRRRRGPAPPQAEAAFGSQADCLANASGVTWEGAAVVSMDPYQVEDKSWRLTVYCLPIGVRAGIQQ